jgi:hypothetical protein
VLEIDYTAYAEAEASLAWLNATAVVRSAQPFAADNLAARLLQGMAQQFAGQQMPIAHLKLQLHAPGVYLKGSVTEAGRPVFWDDWAPGAWADRGQLLVNARIEAAPEPVERTLRGVLAQTAAQLQVGCDLIHVECFRPAAPQPTHRLTAA